MRFFGILLLTVVIGACGVLYFEATLNSAPSERFQTEPITQGDLVSTISATGTIEQDFVDVGAQVMGIIKDFGIDYEAEKTSPKHATPKQVSSTSSDAQDTPTPIILATNHLNSPQNDLRPRIDYCSKVHVGTILAYIDDTKYKAQVRQSQASLDRALADYEQLKAKAFQATADLRRANELRNATFHSPSHNVLVPLTAISEADYDLAVANDKVAQANVDIGKAAIEQSQAFLDQAKNDLAYTIITSPVEGTIVDRRVNVGQTVVAALNAPSLFLIAKDLSRIQVWVSVNEADIGQIHRDMKVLFTVDAFPEETFVGVVKQIRLNAQMTQNVVTYTVVVSADNPEGKLLPYLTANVHFVIDQCTNAPLVSNAALRWKPSVKQVDPKYITIASTESESSDSPEIGYLWTLSENGLVEPIQVAMGISDGVKTAIHGKQVKEGLHVITGEESTKDQDSEGSIDEEFSSTPFLPKPPKGGRPPPPM